MMAFSIASLMFNNQKWTSLSKTKVIGQVGNCLKGQN